MYHWIELSRSALLQNYRFLCRQAQPAEVAVVLKSNAYGHGLARIYEALKNQDIKWIATNYLSEAEQLRQWGYRGHILNVGPIVPTDLPRAFKWDCDVFLSTPLNLQTWLQSEAKARCRAHLKVDTGLSRQGFLYSEIGSLLDSFKSHQALADLRGICTHFANVEDVLEHEYADLQLQRFEAAAQLFEAAGAQLIRHCASSASSLILRQSRFDLVRIGISLYGQWPSSKTRLSFLQHNQSPDELRPVLAWKTRLNLVKEIPSGSYVGYGCSFRTSRPMRLGLIPVGYYEGLPRILSGSPAYVLVHGKRCPIIGRVSMNMATIDLSSAPTATENDEVTLIGKQGDETLSANQLAEWAQTIDYELLTRIHTDTPRYLVD